MLQNSDVLTILCSLFFCKHDIKYSIGQRAKEEELSIFRTIHQLKKFAVGTLLNGANIVKDKMSYTAGDI